MGMLATIKLWTKLQSPISNIQLNIVNFLFIFDIFK